MKLNKIFILFLYCGLSSSCFSQKIISNNFEETEAKAIDNLINYYDNFIFEKTNEKKVHKAYKAFMNKYSPIVIKENNTSYLLPEKRSVQTFLSSFDRQLLEDIFEIEDYYFEYNSQSKTYDTIPSPYSLSLNYDGKYTNFLKELSSSKKKYAFYYSSIEEAAQISPAAFVTILTGYEMINFKNKDERLLFIINMLSLM